MIIIWIFIILIILDYSNCKNVALVSLSFGQKAHKNSIISIYSYLSNSKCDIPFYIITDSSRIFTTYFKKNNKTINNINFIEYDIEYRHINHDMEIKLLKTKLFQFIPKIFDYIIYIDSDITIGIQLDLCFNEMLHYWEDDIAQNTSVVLFKHYRNIEPYHSGVMILHREKSHIFLQKWEEEILTYKFDRDQKALKKIIEKNNIKIGLIEVPIEDFINYDEKYKYLSQNFSSIELLRLATGDFFEKMKPCCFLHYTHFRRLGGKKIVNIKTEIEREYFKKIVKIPFYSNLLQ